MDKFKNSRIYSMVLTALFAALTAVFSQISIPVGPVPVNLALLAVFICGGALGWKRGTVSVAVYILLGVAGVPVFSGFQGGVARLAGPTGGYIIGYLFAVFIVGIMCDKLGRKIRVLPVSMVIGLAVCYAFGTVWFMISTGTGLAKSLMVCVIPFLIGDAAKIIAATLVVKALDKAHLLPDGKAK